MNGIAGGTRNKGTVINSYSLAGNGMPTQIVDNEIPTGSAILSEAEMKGPEFVELLGEGFALDTENINDGFPILVVAGL